MLKHSMFYHLERTSNIPLENHLSHPNVQIAIAEINKIINGFDFQSHSNPSSDLEEHLLIHANQLKHLLKPKLARLYSQQAEAVIQHLLNDYRSTTESLTKQIMVEALRGMKREVAIHKPNHDALFNHKEKVLFETAFAGVIHRNREFLAKGVWPVAKHMADILEATLFNEAIMQRDDRMKKIRSNFYQMQWDAYDEFNKFLGRDQETKLEPEKVEDFKKWALDCLRSDDPARVVSQVFAIHLYVGFITRTDRLGIASLKDLPSELFMSAEDKNIVITNYAQHKEVTQPGYFVQQKDLEVIEKESKANHDTRLGSSASRMPRLGSKDLPLKNSSKENSARNIAGIVPGQGVRGSEDIDLEEITPDLLGLLRDANLSFVRSSAGIHQPCLPLADQIRKKQGKTIDESEHFYEVAIKHGLPLVGGASGGIGAFEVTAKLVKDLSADDLQRYRLMIEGIYLSKGFHAVHEIGSIHNFFKEKGSQRYIPGDYESCIPAGYLKQSDVTILRESFPALLKKKS